MGKGKLKANGLERPFHELQVLSWIFFGIFWISFHILQTPVLPYPATIPVTIFYDVLVVVVIVTCLKTTRSDPRDQCVPDDGRDKWADEDLDSQARRRLQVYEGKVWCPYCKTHVLNRSKHCRLCDKCVEVFDHHCKWFNNCIGKSNYRMFLIAIHSVFAMLCYQGCSGAYLLMTSVERHAWTMDAITQAYGPSLTQDGYTALLSIHTGLIVPLLALCGHLILLHWMLVFRDQTTFEYIMDKRERTKAAEQARQQRKNALEMKALEEKQNLVKEQTKVHAAKVVDVELTIKEASGPLGPSSSPSRPNPNPNPLGHAPTTRAAPAAGSRKKKKKKKKAVAPSTMTGSATLGQEGQPTKDQSVLPGMMSPSAGYGDGTDDELEEDRFRNTDKTPAGEQLPAPKR